MVSALGKKILRRIHQMHNGDSVFVAVSINPHNYEPIRKYYHKDENCQWLVDSGFAVMTMPIEIATRWGERQEHDCSAKVLD